MSFDNSQVVESSSIKPNIKGTENCRLVDIQLVKSKEGEAKVWTAIEFTVKDSTGGTLKDRIFYPEDKTANPPFPDYNYEKEKNNIMGRIKHYQNRYMSEEASKATRGETWEQYVTAVINSFPAGYKEIPCKLHVIWEEGKDKNGKVAYFPKLRKYPPFISTEKYPKEFTEKLNKNEFFDIPSKTASSTPGEPGGVVASGPVDTNSEI